jgi:hypothetical protein
MCEAFSRGYRHCTEDCPDYVDFVIGTSANYGQQKTISVKALISWLEDQKYRIDETSDNMTEEFEKEHQWELSRNCFINKMIKKLEEL